MSDEIDLLKGMLKNNYKQNEIIISLLGRISFHSNTIQEIVTKNKKKPKKYIDGYNACNGENNVSQIAKIVGVTDGTISPILSDWEEIKIIYEVEREGGKYYKKLFPI